MDPTYTATANWDETQAILAHQAWLTSDSTHHAEETATSFDARLKEVTALMDNLSAFGDASAPGFVHAIM